MQDTDRLLVIFMVSWLIFENRSDVGKFKRRWEFWRTSWFLKLNTNKFCKVINSHRYISVLWDLVEVKLLISFETVFVNVRKIKIWSLMKWMQYVCNTWMVSILRNCLQRWTLNVLIKKISFTSWFATSVLSEASFLFSKFYVDFVFSDRKGFIVYVKFLLSIIFFILRLGKYFYFLFVTKKHKSFFA